MRQGAYPLKRTIPPRAEVRSPFESGSDATYVVTIKKTLTPPASIGYKGCVFRGGAKYRAERLKNWLHDSGVTSRGLTQIQGVARTGNVCSWSPWNEST